MRKGVNHHEKGVEDELGLAPGRMYGQTRRKWQHLGGQPREERPRPLGGVEGAGPLLGKVPGLLSGACRAVSGRHIQPEEPVGASCDPPKTATSAMLSHRQPSAPCRSNISHKQLDVTWARACVRCGHGLAQRPWAVWGS